MAKDGDELSLNIGSITGGQNNIGKTEIQGGQHQTVNHGDVTITFEEIVKTIREEIPEGELIDFNDVMQPLEDVANEELPASEEEKVSLKEKIFAMAERLGPFVPHIRKSIAAFGEGALGKLASSSLPPPSSWVVAGVIEICRDNRHE